MITDIGVMVAGYIIFRCIEIMCRADSTFGSRGQKTAVCVVGLIGILATGVLAADLILGSSSSGGTPPRAPFEIPR